MKVLALTRYGRLGASSRVRMLQHVSWLDSAGVQVEVQPLIGDDMLRSRYEAGTYSRSAMLGAYRGRLQCLGRRRRYDLLWIEKEALPWFPASIERAWLQGVPYVLDYDDALFHNYDLHRSKWVRRLLGRRIDRLMAGASLIVAGNEYLAKRARDAGARWVEILPTVVDLDRYPIGAVRHEGSVQRIVWIGSPSTAVYVQDLAEPLRRLAARHAIKLRVIGAELAIPGVDVECVPWTEDTEAESIAQCDIGIMPLKDSPWERGKCGYKLIQYMACGLPVVASPVGVNVQIVREGENGFLADGPQDWEIKMSQLLDSSPLRSSMGTAGRARVEQAYCVQEVAPRLAQMLIRAGAR